VRAGAVSEGTPYARAIILTPDRRVRVFVSSTLEELAEERAAARQAIEKLRLTPVMFELGARPHPPRDVYRTYLEQSDVFVGIYGESYGWVAPGMDISGLEDELRQAERIPRLLYVKRAAPLRDPRLAALVTRVEDEADVSYRLFSDAAELGTLIEDDLALLLSERFAAPRRPRSPALPAPVDRFVGRRAELEELERLLVEPDRRLVTVTGPGGVGKTRLALEAARRIERRYSDGVQLVLLAPIADPGLVPTTICERLGAPHGSASPLAAAIDELRDAELLLVLDNFEHVLAAAPDVEELLEGSPGVDVLVTSRAILKLRGERELRIEPLAEEDAVTLFAERAGGPLDLTEETREAIEEISRRLERIPLALELAAAQTRLLPPSAILERLSGPLSLHAAGGPTYPDRHRTVEAAVDWSFGLLDENERALCLRAGVFRGGFTLDALEGVADTGGEGSVLELLATLVESSLVRVEEGPRYSMLETIRTYAVQRLDERGELAEARDSHAAFFARLIDETGDSLRRAGHEPVLRTLDADADNIRAAVDWLLERGQVERVVAAVWALLPYLTLRERFPEGRRWLTEARERGASSGRAVIGDGAIAFWASDYLTAASFAVEGRDRAGDDGDEEALAVADLIIGTLETMRGAEHGVAMLEECRRRFAELGNEWGELIALIGIAWGLNAAEAEAPLDLYETTVARARGLGFPAETLAIGALGRRLAILGDADGAKRVLVDALERTQALHADVGTALYADVLADLAAVEGKDRLAARLSAAAEAGAESAAAFLPPLSGDRVARLRGVRERIGDAAFEAEQDAGRGMALADAAAEARAFALAADRPA
jgi:predicted ATPase